MLPTLRLICIYLAPYIRRYYKVYAFLYFFGSNLNVTYTSERVNPLSPIDVI